jgi:opacity protein-like surface antigen
MKRLAVAAVLLALLALCAVASAAGSLGGTYQTKIGSKPLGGKLKGTWTIKFSHGIYVVSDNGNAAVRGKYTISGSKVSLGHETGPLACPSSGSYTFTISGKRLRFTHPSAGAKACAGRAIVLAGHFTKIS